MERPTFRGTALAERESGPFAPARLTPYRTGTRASRKPMLLLRNDGESPLRTAAWQPEPWLIQQPPRFTRFEPPGKASAHHCHTFPSISHKPNLFAGYAPTRVGRPRYFPVAALPDGWLPSKFAWSDDRSLVGLSR